MRQLAALLLLGGMSVHELHACAPAPHAGDIVAIVEESAAIVWEPATKTQHFIRRATFRGAGRDFGFLVPTPAAPVLAEVDSALFDDLHERTKRQTVYVNKRKIDWTPLLASLSGNKDAATATTTGVQVLATEKVAGYEAAVLDASDANELQQWLAANGYAATPDLTAWLDVYVQKRWKITAFKVDPKQSFAARTSAVKMSFPTDRPFFPYREPSQPDLNTNRMLRVWFIGPERVSGVIGESTTWPAALQRSDAMPDELRGSFTRMSGVALPGSARLTAFEDYSSLRARDDLYFLRAADQSGYVQPPFVIENVQTTHIPLDAVGLIALVALALLILLRRRILTA